MGTALEGGEGIDLDAGGGGRWRKTLRRGKGPQQYKIFYLECFVFTSWLIGVPAYRTFDLGFYLGQNQLHK